MFAFNLQFDVYTYSDSFLGADISDVEDSAALIAATLDASEQADTLPIALLLDGKPCNHTDEVHAALGDTSVIPETAYRDQNKAHVEGGFGLLKPPLQGLSLDTSSPRELAGSFLRGLSRKAGFRSVVDVVAVKTRWQPRRAFFSTKTRSLSLRWQPGTWQTWI